MSEDKRHFPRLDVKAPALFKVPEQMDISMASIKNVSVGGICLLSRETAPEGKIVELEFSLPGIHTIRAHAKVMWADKLNAPDSVFQYMLGLSFEKIDEEKQKKISRFIIARLRAQIKEQMEPIAPGEKKKKLLSIDDDRVMLSLVKQIFNKEFTVFTATEGHAGIEIARREKPDIILLDLIMPGIDGFSTLTLLKDFEETRNIPILILSVIRDKSKIFQAINHGASDYILKPFATGKLVEKITKIVYG